ncbi:MAG: hypothetical protein ACK4P3_03010 [Fimbriimonadaceae bacterium]
MARVAVAIVILIGLLAGLASGQGRSVWIEVDCGTTAQADWPVQIGLLEMIREGTDGTARTQFELTRRLSGVDLVATWAPGRLRFILGGPREGVELVASQLRAMIERPRLSENEFNRVLGRLRAEPSSVWGQMLLGSRINFEELRFEDVVRLASQSLTPGTVREYRSAGNQWVQQDTWTDFRQLAPIRSVPRSSGTMPVQLPAAIRPIRIDLGQIEAGEVDKTIAAFLLGVGKSSSLFETMRQKFGLSYRQEVAFVPFGNGYRLVVVIGSGPGETDQLNQALVEMHKQVDTWTVADIERAVSMYNRAVAEAHPFSPFYYGLWQSATSGVPGPTWRLPRQLSADSIDPAKVQAEARLILERTSVEL